MKRKIINKPIYVLGILFLTFFGCVDLDEKPLDFTGPDNYYNNPEQIESSYTAALKRIFARWGIFSYNGFTGIHKHTDQLAGGDLAFSENLGNRSWRDHFASISDVNLALKAMSNPDTKIPESELPNLIGQGRFIRAFNYFYLVRLYGDVPIIDENVNPITDEIVRKPIAEVYAFIVEDLLYAANNLPEEWPDSPGKPTADAARGLLAKVYLTMATAPLKATENFAKARDMAAEVMHGNHDLVEHIEDVFAIENENGVEILFSTQNIEGIGVNATSPAIWLPGHMANGWGDITADREWFLHYPEQPRKYAYLLMEDWDGLPYTDFPDGETYAIRKYLYSPREMLEKNVSNQNLPLLRFADILLIFAEAENMVNGGPTQAAVNALNRVINRANGYVVNPAYPLAQLSMSQAAFDRAVINERSYELCFEFDRWFDLVRKEMLCEVQNEDAQVNCSSDDYLMPIPQVDLRLNPLLTQNPGYPAP